MTSTLVYFKHHFMQVAVGTVHIQRGSVCADLYWLNRDCHHTATRIRSVQFILSVPAHLLLQAAGSECVLCLCK
jgi:hypothetical protein